MLRGLGRPKSYHADWDARGCATRIMGPRLCYANWDDLGCDARIRTPGVVPRGLHTIGCATRARALLVGLRGLKSLGLCHADWGARGLCCAQRFYSAPLANLACRPTPRASTPAPPHGHCGGFLNRRSSQSHAELVFPQRRATRIRSPGNCAMRVKTTESCYADWGALICVTRIRTPGAELNGLRIPGACCAVTDAQIVYYVD